MPIEIRELHIKVSVTSPDTSQADAQNASSGAAAAAFNTNYTEDIVAACVEKVMEILKNKTER
jgi:hypothetical protein